MASIQDHKPLPAGLLAGRDPGPSPLARAMSRQLVAYL